DCVGGFEQQADPPPALLLREVAIEVTLDHVRMAAVLVRVRLRTTEHFADKRGDVAWMLGAHAREHGPQQGICLDAFIERRRQPVKCLRSPEPLVEAGNVLISHGSSLPPDGTSDRLRTSG